MKKRGIERRVYKEEFKTEAVALVEKRENPVSQSALNLGINKDMLRRWMQQGWKVAVIFAQGEPQ
ncbi:MAG: transposase [Treponema sp.]|jgi:transposase-like protein|nr:transposase [Treponema sp.]